MFGFARGLVIGSYVYTLVRSVGRRLASVVDVFFTDVVAIVHPLMLLAIDLC